MDKEIVANFENLYRSYKKVKSGKKINSGTARFSNLSLEGIHLLKEQLELLILDGQHMENLQKKMPILI